VPMTVQFTDKSVSAGTTTYKWDVNNDGVIDYTTQNPVHKYTTAGTYTVKVTVGNTSGSDTETKTNYITVSSTSIISGETFGAEPNPTGNPIGGGPGYTRIISETDPNVKYVVSTKAQLISALNNAKSGEIIFVKGTAKIDLTNTYQLKIPGGVTLASDRGHDGSPGGLLYRHRGNENTWAQIFTFVAGGDNVRVTGLRLNGENAPQDDTSANENLYLVGILFQQRQGAVVDNCELWGWSQSGIIVDRGNSYIHHNYIHHNQARGEGYGVTVNGGFALIEANLFDYNRHSIDGEGVPGESYEARYNIHLGHGDAIGGHHFDVHGYPAEAPTQIGGNKYLIHHNTFLNSELMAVGVRAQPATGFYIDHNIFQMKYNDYPVVYKIKTGSWDKMFMSRNLIARNGGKPVLVEGADYWKYHY
jgi:PKD repeat protein